MTLVSLALRLREPPLLTRPDGTEMDPHMERAPNASQPRSETNTDTRLTDGVVKKIDRQNAMITLDHGEIKNVGMPATTMAYKARDAAMIDSVKGERESVIPLGKHQGGLCHHYVEKALTLPSILASRVDMITVKQRQVTVDFPIVKRFKVAGLELG